MNKTIYTTIFCLLMLAALPAGAQKYDAADSVKLNKEIVEVSNDISSLTARLAIAQNNLPGVREKAREEELDAQKAAEKSSERAARASSGDVKDARRAKKEARRAYREAKDARKAHEEIGDQEKKIASLQAELAKKQARLEQLNARRAAQAAPAGQ
ncbi:hypothetical protein [Flaviaesturariibacter amylovorans]